MSAALNTSDSENSTSPKRLRSPVFTASPKASSMNSETLLTEANPGQITGLQTLASDDSFLDSSPHLSPVEPNSPPAFAELTPGFQSKPSENGHGSVSPTLPRPETEIKSKVASKGVSKAYTYQVPRRPSMARDELKQCGSILKALKRHVDSGPFLEPVDIVKFNIPDYPDIIKHPMDLDTVEKKLDYCEYDIVDEFFADIQRIFDNCYLYNGRGSDVSKMASNLEALFNKFKKNFSHASELLEQESAPHRSVASTKASKSKQNSRKSSQSHITSKSLTESSRPPKSPVSKKLKSKMPEHHYKFCRSLVNEFFKSEHKVYAFPFLEPVDWVEMNIPDYPHIIKNPMDLSTIRKKFEANVYASPFELEHDIRLIFSNCYKYNSSKGEIFDMGKTLEAVFLKKWSQRPFDLQLKDNDGLSSDNSSSSPLINSRPISNKHSRKTSKTEFSPRLATGAPGGPGGGCLIPRDSKTKKKPLHLPSKRSTPILDRHSSPSKTKPRKPSKKDTKHRAKMPEEITYDQKIELSSAINSLTGEVLTVVVDLIHRSMPEIGKSQGEIELDIDLLDSRTLSTLYTYVMSVTNGNTHNSFKSKSPRSDSKPSRSRLRHDTELDSRHNHSSVRASKPLDLPKKSRSSESKKRPKSPLSSSSSSGSDSGSDSTSSALPNQTQSSRSKASSSLTSKEKGLVKNTPTSNRYLQKKGLDSSIKSKGSLELNSVPGSVKPANSKKTTLKPTFTPKSPRSHTLSNLKDNEPSISSPKATTPTKSASRHSTVDASWVLIQAQLREEKERIDKKKRMSTFELAEEERLRQERKQKREEEFARQAAQKKKELIDAALIKSKADQAKRLASVALYKDLLLQNRIMSRFEENMSREVKEELIRGQHPSLDSSRGISQLYSSKTPPLPSSLPPPPPSISHTYSRTSLILEEGELEEGELIE